MKKKYVIAILFTAMVFMTSCGQKAVENTGDNTIIESTENKTEAETEEVANTEDVEIQNTEYEADAIGEGCFWVQMEEQSESYKADDGKEIFTNLQNYPKLSSKEKSEIAEIINADIESMQTNNKKDAEEQLKLAKEDYAYRMETATSDTEEIFLPFPYQIQSTSVVMRNDAKIFSFAVDDYAYFGGAHGEGGTTGYNYDAMTGERLKLDDLAEDASAFKNHIRSYVKEQCEKEVYKERVFEEYETYLDDAIFAEDSWYFTENGILISCPPYSLGCYAAGSINFEISYETLKAYGLKEDYSM